MVHVADARMSPEARSVPRERADLLGSASGMVRAVQSDQSTRPVGVALNVLAAGQPPSTTGSR
jgi:hypothetical protein